MPPAYRAHPEFGYFCLSRGFRRKLLAALAVIGLGALASAVVVGGSRESRDDASPPAAEINAASSSASTPSAADQATVTAAKPGPTESHRPVCEGETWTYIDGKCIAGKAQKPRIAAIDSPPIAAIPLGRTAPPPAAQPPAKSERASEATATPPASKSERVAETAAAPPSKSQRATDTAATEPAAAATPAAAAEPEPAVQSTSASKERRKVARERASRDERRNARTAASDNRKPKSATGWTKQVRSAEQFVRALFTPGI
ncbi:MAG TPA: hypothetical protein VH392_10110 [Sphingomicrobium sp.]